MNLRNKKKLVARMLSVGTGRIAFDESRLSEIKESLTRQDIRDLIKSKAIKLKEKKGKKKIIKRKTKRRKGKRKKIIKKRKTEYVILIRKLRKTLKNLKRADVITKEKYNDLRKKVRAKAFRSRAHLMEAIK